MPYQITTLATLQARLADKWEGVPFWTAEEARLAINEGLRWWNLLVGAWKQRVVIASGANQVWYNTPATLLYPLKIDWDSAPMVQSTFGDLDLGRPKWEGETTGTTGAPNVPTLWVPGGFTLVAIWPADASGTGSFGIDGVTPAPVLVAPTSFIDLGEEEISVLLGFALHIAAFKLGGERFAATMPYYTAFLRHAALKNARLLKVKAFRELLGRHRKEDSVPGPPEAVPTS